MRSRQSRSTAAAPTLEQRLQALRRCSVRERHAALAAALPHAPESDAGPIAIELMELATVPDTSGKTFVHKWLRVRARARADAVLSETVQGCWRVPEGCFSLLGAVARDRLDSIAQDVAASCDSRWMPPPERLLSVSRAASELKHPALAPALSRVLHNDHSEARAAAADALLGMVRTPDNSRWEHEPDALRVVARAVADACWSFGEHGQRSVLRAAMELLAQPGELPDEERARLERLLSDSDHPASKGMRGLLRYDPSPTARARAWEWLTRRSMAAASLDRLARAQHPDEHDAVMARAHLALHPDRARHLRTIELRAIRRHGEKHWSLPAASVLPDEVTLLQLPHGAQRGLPRLAEAIGMKPEVRHVVLRPLVASADPMARLLAASACDPRDLPDFCLDAHPRVAALAAGRWSMVGERPGLRTQMGEAGRIRRRLSSRLRTSAHDPVRARVAGEGATGNCWEPACPRSRMLARQRLEQGRERFVDELRERLLGGDTRAETGALLLIRRLELERSLEPELLSFIRGGSRQERALATGVMLLARLDSAESSAALLNAATHEDQRVRANAIEAIGRRVRRGSLAGLESLQEVYEPWPGDDHHRVRANALRGLLHEWPEKIEPKPIRLRDSAVEELLRMLVDERTMHRLAGVWLAERALVEPRGVGRRRSGVELALAERAHEDSDATVRDRAISGVARLDALARHGAGKRAGHLAVPIWRRPGTKDGGRA